MPAKPREGGDRAFLSVGWRILRHILRVSPVLLRSPQAPVTKQMVRRTNASSDERSAAAQLGSTGVGGRGRSRLVALVHIDHPLVLPSRLRGSERVRYGLSGRLEQDGHERVARKV